MNNKIIVIKENGLIQSNLYDKVKQLNEKMVVREDGKGILSLNSIENSDDVFAVVNNDSIISYLAVSRNRASGLAGSNLIEKEKMNNYVYVEQIVVDSDYQNKKIGTLLFNFMLDYYDIYDYVYLNVSLKNEKALSFYQKHGYKDCQLFTSNDFYGIKDYKSYLMKKKIKEL